MSEYKLRKDEIDLLSLAQKGCLESRNLFINQNLNLVHYFVKKNSENASFHDDLVQEAILGMAKAVDKFDFEKGNRFSTYAIFWIRRSLIKYRREKIAMIRVPYYIYNTYGREKKSGEKDSERLKDINKKLSMARHISSFDDPIFNEGPLIIEETLTATNPCIEETILQEEKFKEVHLALKLLPERERQILEYRYGFYEGREYLLKEIAFLYNLSKERVRQLEKRALKRLREILTDGYN